MPEIPSLLTFALVALGLVLTPGPNMIYLISRSICQGRKAGLVSLGGVALGFVFYMLCAAFGITALIFAVPYAYDVLRISGVVYLLYLAWQIAQAGMPKLDTAVKTQTIKPWRFHQAVLFQFMNPREL